MKFLCILFGKFNFRVKNSDFYLIPQGDKKTAQEKLEEKTLNWHACNFLFKYKGTKVNLNEISQIKYAKIFQLSINIFHL